MNSSEQHLTPSVEEFTGWYNLGYERDDGQGVLQSDSDVPPFEHSEFFQLYSEERDWFEKELVPAIGSHHVDPLAGPPMFVRSQADDRTLEVYPDFSLLTIEVLRRIQQEFLARHPLWRVLLAAEKSTCSIMVYPTVARFGNLPPPIDWQEGLDRVKAEAITLKEERLRPQRHEVSFLENRLPAAIDRWGAPPFRLLGMRDRAVYDPSCLSLFLLFRGAESYQYELDGPPNYPDDFLASSTRYGVNAEGKLISQIDVPQTAPFHVRQWLLPSDYRGPLTLVNTETGEQHRIEIREEDIVRTPP